MKEQSRSNKWRGDDWIFFHIRLYFRNNYELKEDNKENLTCTHYCKTGEKQDSNKNL